MALQKITRSWNWEIKWCSLLQTFHFILKPLLNTNLCYLIGPRVVWLIKLTIFSIWLYSEAITKRSFDPEIEYHILASAWNISLHILTIILRLPCAILLCPDLIDLRNWQFSKLDIIPMASQKGHAILKLRNQIITSAWNISLSI